MSWIVIILAILAWIAFRFFSDLNAEGKKVKEAGGMRKKYAILVDYVLSGHSDCRIISESSTDIIVGATGMSGSTTFQIIQSFNETVIIKYEVKSIVWGNHSLDWTFNESIGQQAMIETMKRDIETQMKEIIQKYQ